jgi:dihydroorotate dehydrogenase
MSVLPYSFARSFLFGMDPEQAHELTLGSLQRLQNTPLQCLWAQPRVLDPLVVAGLHFPNRVGLAAGLDKNGAAIDGLGAMGFGFIEVGTVTPQAQPGNPKPRIFRLPEAQALINRLGFNNHGLEAFVRNVRRSRFRQGGGILGLNIGKNAHTPIERAVDDYLLCLTGVYSHADYVAVNISSPNTQNLRSLQNDAALDNLLAAVQERKAELALKHQRAVPIFVKIAPDLDTGQIDALAAALQRHRIDGVIATNTTIERHGLNALPNAKEAGGLSGAPLLQASNQVITQLRKVLGEAYPIIGVGGVLSAADACAKVQAGADLVQIYTGLIYRGPELVHSAAKALFDASKTRASL